MSSNPNEVFQRIIASIDEKNKREKHLRRAGLKLLTPVPNFFLDNKYPEFIRIETDESFFSRMQRKFRERLSAFSEYPITRFLDEEPESK